jgi:hypothetical protein
MPPKHNPLLNHSLPDTARKWSWILQQINLIFFLSKSISQDYNKPLLIPAGSDSMQQIGGLGVTRTGAISKGPGAAIDRWKHTFTTHFPQVIILQN